MVYHGNEQTAKATARNAVDQRCGVTYRKPGNIGYIDEGRGRASGNTHPYSRYSTSFSSWDSQRPSDIFLSADGSVSEAFRSNRIVSYQDSYCEYSKQLGYRNTYEVCFLHITMPLVPAPGPPAISRFIGIGMDCYESCGKIVADVGDVPWCGVARRQTPLLKFKVRFGESLAWLALRSSHLTRGF
jgi:hypothetical protein